MRAFALGFLTALALAACGVLAWMAVDPALAPDTTTDQESAPDASPTLPRIVAGPSPSAATLNLNRYQSEASLTQIGPLRPVLIHVRHSDPPAGEHEIGGESVVVGAELWSDVR